MDVLQISNDALREYIMSVSNSFLNTSVAELSQALNDELLGGFISDPNCHFLFLAKANQQVTASNDIELKDNYQNGIIIFKRQPVLEDSRLLNQQILVMNVPEGSPYEIIHSYITHAASPFFETASKTETAAESKSGIPVAKKKFAELELSLLNLQQKVDIPEIRLQIDPTIASLIEKGRSSNEKVSAEMLGDLLNDSTYLNKIQSQVNDWIREIQKVTKMTRDPSIGSALQEINFWISMEKSLQSIENQLKGDEITLTMDVLKYAKRFHATVSFIADTGIKEAMDLVTKYNLLMRDFPLNELLSAPDLDKLKESVIDIFSHLNKKLKLCPYPIKRALPFVESISKDFNDQLIKIISSKRLMYLNYEAFEKEISKTNDCLEVWNEQIKEFSTVARDVTRKRGEKFIVIKVNNAHSKLVERIQLISNFRKLHNQLLVTVAKVMFDSKQEILQIESAYEQVRSIDVLDTSNDGNNIWISAENAYNANVSHLENQIISLLKSLLSNAKNANEMFRVFSKFNALFVRAKIRGAIQEYQNQLIDNVKDDMHALQEKFKVQYRNSQSYVMDQVYDIPPVSGSIMWAKQIDNQLDVLIKRLENILGQGWHLYSEGAKLQSETQSFKKKLETRSIFDAWIQEMSKKDLQIQGKVFEVIRNRALGIGQQYQLAVNFESQVITLFKEVRNLIWLGFTVPHNLVNSAKEAKRIYPHAVSLMEAVRSYNQTMSLIKSQNENTPPSERKTPVKMLLEQYRYDVQQSIHKGMQLKWEFFNVGGDSSVGNKYEHYVKDFSNVVNVFYEKTKIAFQANDEIHELIQQLQKCPFVFDQLQSILDEIQKKIDEMNLEVFSNLTFWVAEINNQVGNIFIKRLEHAVRSWQFYFTNQPEEANEFNYLNPNIPKINHDIIVKNQLMVVQPPIEKSREDLLRHFQKWIGTICFLNRLSSNRFDMDLKHDQDIMSLKVDNAKVDMDSVMRDFSSSKNYKYLVHYVFPSLKKTYSTIDNELNVVGAYVQEWLQYQALWDLTIQHITGELGDDLVKWQTLLTELKKLRMTIIDTETSRKSFDSNILEVDYANVQSKVNAKYDTWQKEILAQFASKLAAFNQSFYNEINGNRTSLETNFTSLNDVDTMKSIQFITLFQGLKKKKASWVSDIEVCRQSEQILERSRFQFPSDWIFVDQLDGEWSAFEEIYKRKSAIIQEKLMGLQAKVLGQDQIIDKKIHSFIEEWNVEKPMKGDFAQEKAVSILATFESKLNQLQDEKLQVFRAKEALELDIDTTELDSSFRVKRLLVISEELNDLKFVWESLGRVWQVLNADFKSVPWNQCIPRKLRQVLEHCLNEVKELPARCKQYAAFEFLQETIKGYIKYYPIANELKSESFKERHWRILFKQLKLEDTRFNEMTVSFVFDNMDLKANEKLFKETITIAQGEMALEEFLRQVKDFWQSFTLEMVNYQNKCKLIKGWDDLFGKCNEHLSNLKSMKLSPYYKTFEEEASGWEVKINKVLLIFDLWIDVQRQWVYLEGIFNSSSSSDIKHLLPIETSKFQTMNAEFLALMKKVNKSPFPLDIIAIPQLQKGLERLLELLVKLQKALGEYLEKERSSFPRFYFIGDEDLLEIIGNSKDLIRVQKHFKKMFAGVNLLMFEDTPAEELPTIITGVTSKEGEKLHFGKSINTSKFNKINEWLLEMENEIKNTLHSLLIETVDRSACFYEGSEVPGETFLRWIEEFPDQLIVLSTQIHFTNSVEKIFDSSDRVNDKFKVLSQTLENMLAHLSRTVLKATTADGYLLRKKAEHLITELVYHRDLVRLILSHDVKRSSDFEWLKRLRFYWKKEGNKFALSIKMANAVFTYGYEYLGVPDRLVKTPLTDMCYLTLTQALSAKLGASPFGPAGTGKTETVKSLAIQLGKLVLVFCCDETFDFQAMGRIFIGICQVGAFSCFDEFNRLEERMLSAVSQQVQTIQLALKDSSQKEITLLDKSLVVHPETGIFITMNPNYAGRSNLPDNLKKLFRSIAMTKPDVEMISQVMLFSQEEEQKVLIKSVMETVLPKLVELDVPLMKILVADVFPGIVYDATENVKLTEHIKSVCRESGFLPDDSWIEKVFQLYQMQKIHHGLMLVGSSSSGKSSCWKVLLKALSKYEGIEGVSYVIDPVAISKDILYGSLDQTTREWNDGLFTAILRKIIDNVRGEQSKRHWIVFDGNINPEWVENLNSALDDNKILTLPNGERLALPSNVRILFEVESVQYATLATVSRCGMIWFHERILTVQMMLFHQLNSIETNLEREFLEEFRNPEQIDMTRSTIQKSLGYLKAFFVDASGNSFVEECLKFAKKSIKSHIMDFITMRGITALFSLISKALKNLISYNLLHIDFPVTEENTSTFLLYKLASGIVWAFAGDCGLADRALMMKYLKDTLESKGNPVTISLDLLDYDVSLPNADLFLFKIPKLEVDTQKVSEADIVIPTVDTVRNDELIYSWLADHKPFLLCGPPGSGKTMSLLNALRKLPDLEVVSLNFSSATTPELVQKTLEQYCEYQKTVQGVLLSPNSVKWLVLFCDEINLPNFDSYGTQRVISFLRQLIEQEGFYRQSDKQWVKIERIQFVGACNPPTDPGRKPLSHRFLRHSPVLFVDYPSEAALNQIYGTFVRSLLKLAPNLKGYADSLTAAMVEFYLESQKRFTADIQAHYVYSPRELTRWMRGIYECIRPMDVVTLENLVRIWAHEALRLFSDRLVDKSERQWTEELIDQLAEKHFKTKQGLERPILFSNWLSKHYVSVDRGVLKEFVKARLKNFYEEELDVPLVLFNDVLDHVLRIDRVFRQIQGHLLLIGVSGSGKTTLSRFVAWMNGLSVFQVKIHNKYTMADFDEDLRGVLRRCACKNEKIAFIIDESNVLDSSFLERINTLLANGEIPGLFQDEDLNLLMSQLKEASQKDGLMLDSTEELYKWFTSQIMKNLHVVFTMNPPLSGLGDRTATSPALFNRCVLDWFGDWSKSAFYEVCKEFMSKVDLEVVDSQKKASSNTLSINPLLESLSRSTDMISKLDRREAIHNAFVFIHLSMYNFSERLHRRLQRKLFITPRHYLDFIHHFLNLFQEKQQEIEDHQRHINSGLTKLFETFRLVNELSASFELKKTELEVKNKEANNKLQLMISEQQEAEKSRNESIEIQKALQEQNRAVESRKKLVLEELAIAEPAVIEAQQNVSNIKKQHLTEIRSMSNPPDAVKLTMEAVCILLGFTIDSWKAVQSVLRRDDFINSIVNYNTDVSLTAPIREKISAEYMNNPQFTFEVVNRASKACGPLLSWVIAQMNYSVIIEKVGPLRNEVQELENQANETKKKAAKIEDNVNALEVTIKQLKDEYASLISQVQMIKQEMENVKIKVTRSQKLLDSLQSEKFRWENTSKNFHQQFSTVSGDCILASAYIAYAGYFDQHFRRLILTEWKDYLQTLGIQFKENMLLSDYLATTDEKLVWKQEYMLPADDLCMENAVMLQRFKRYPLIIDPSGQSLEFLNAKMKGQKTPLVTSSFLDDAFVKNLESCVRFGNKLLIQDVEKLDPILNPILNREIKRAGGRVLVRLGNQDIDLSPSFELFLLTRDPLAKFSPDLSSRVTFVNFTITKESLHSQCLHQVLRFERPDIEKKRNDLIGLQGEFLLKTTKLEKQLLKLLSETEGNILDNDTLVDTLENLKLQVSEITAKSKETEAVMAQVNQTTNFYIPIAQSCSQIYYVLEQLSLFNHFYKFSLPLFQQIFTDSLVAPRTIKPFFNELSLGDSNLDAILNNLYKVTYERVSRSLKFEDCIVLALILCFIRLQLLKSEKVEQWMNHFFENSFALKDKTLVDTPESLLLKDTDLFKEYDTQMSTPLSNFILNLVCLKTAKPEKAVKLVTIFAERILGFNVITRKDNPLYQYIKESENVGFSPILIVSPAGYDVSNRVEVLSKDIGKRLVVIAMGSVEGFSLAEKAIMDYHQNAETWVLLKNVHLAPQWLIYIEKRLYALKPSKSFRLFMTTEENDKVPTNLIFMSRVFYFQSSIGLQASLFENLNQCQNIKPASSETLPTERSRLLFLLSMLQSTLIERRRYIPLGWSKPYEFNDTDLECGLMVIDHWLGVVNANKSHIAPDKIPWETIKNLLFSYVYGSKIDNEYDLVLLRTFIDQWFCVESFESKFKLAEGLFLDDSTKLEQFVEWVDKNLKYDTPEWLGLPGSAEQVLSLKQGEELVMKAKRLKGIILDEDDDELQEEKTGMSKVLQERVKTLLAEISKDFRKERTEQSTAKLLVNALDRFYEREFKIAREIIRVIKRDLEELDRVLAKNIKSTNVSRQLQVHMTEGTVPKNWSSYYKIPKNCSFNAFMSDLFKRLDQFRNIGGNQAVWLGGLFNPDGYIAATRQIASHKNGISLEDLELTIQPQSNSESFELCDLIIFGAKAEPKDNQFTLKASSEISFKLSSSHLYWVKRTEAKPGVKLPVYYNNLRDEILFSFPFSNVEAKEFYQHGVAIIANDI